MNDRIGWVIGGGSGIGLGIARALADDGYDVFITGRRADVLERAAATYADAYADAYAESREAGRSDRAGDQGAPRVKGSLLPIPGDVTSEADLARAMARIRGHAGSLSVVVISSGVNVAHRSLADTTADEWRSLVEINATGTFLVMKQVVPVLQEAGGGLIVNISSISGIRSLTIGGVAYCASKFASSSLGIFAGNELAAHGIRVTNIYPGEVSTPILDKRAVPPTAERRAQMVQPADIGALVALIARLPAAAHVSELVIKPLYQELV